MDILLRFRVFQGHGNEVLEANAASGVAKGEGEGGSKNISCRMFVASF